MRRSISCFAPEFKGDLRGKWLVDRLHVGVKSMSMVVQLSRS